MNDALNAEDLEALREQLSARRAELLAEIREEMRASENQQYVEMAGQVHDEAEAAVATLLSDVNLASVERHHAEIEAIEAALQRMERGTYGVCVDCEEAIPVARLRAYPTAQRCIADQERYEHLYGRA